MSNKSKSQAYKTLYLFSTIAWSINLDSKEKVAENDKFSRNLDLQMIICHGNGKKDEYTSVELQRELLNEIKTKKSKDHIKRHSNVLKIILEGKVEGKTARGRQKCRRTAYS